jgi:low affinity Fe/Cu permease
MHDLFRAFAARVSVMVGSAGAFVAAIVIVVIWAALGPLYHYSDTWQLVINTGTTIITFLMVFLIQNSQNRDAKAIHLKLDELLKGVKGARTELVNVEGMSDKDLDELQREFAELGKRYAARTLERLRQREKDPQAHGHGHNHKPHEPSPQTQPPTPAPPPANHANPQTTPHETTPDDQND